MSSPPSASDQQIRSRLLNKLGIYDSLPESVKSQHRPMTAAQHRRLRILRSMGLGYTLDPTPPDGSAVRPPLNGVKPFQEPLKSEDAAAPKKKKPAAAKTNNNNNNTQSTRTIAFEEDVQVVPIPTRYEYSDRIKSRIWSNRHELQENAERNALEFAAEGWNWRNVTEDEGMYICSVSGELVHPIHLQHLVSEDGSSSATKEERKTGLERGSPVHSS